MVDSVKTEDSPLKPATDLLTPSEVAERLRISTTAVYALCDAGELPCHRIGLGTKRKRIRVAEKAVADYLNRTAQEMPATIQMPLKKRRSGGSVSQVAGCSMLRSFGWKGG